MQGFSGIVRISNVSDFIEPSQKCILPLENLKNAESQQSLVGIHSKILTANHETKSEHKIKVTLSDCLACSGCITTAEAMLVESQTVKQMLKGFASHKLSIVTVSPQSLTSLCVHFGFEPAEMAIKLTQFFKLLGADYVIDSSFARILSRRLGYNEFREILFNGSKVKVLKSSKRKMLLTGACPGFVCYAEKTHGELLVQQISHVRSPQAITALLVKDFLRRKKFPSFSAAEIFHVSVMPCYDKKLEASRSDFIMQDGISEVDCVVTASELIDLISSSEEYQQIFYHASASSSFLAEAEFVSKNWLNRFEYGVVIGDENRESSGGYADFIVQSLLREFPDATMTRLQKNKDLEEFQISASEFGDELIVVAKLYGFRNIQNAVQKLKRNKLHIDFAEVMACPSGCSNGGGQIRAESTEERAKISMRVNDAYEKLRLCKNADTELDEILTEWKHLNPDIESALFTEYHAIKPNSMTLLGESW